MRFWAEAETARTWIPGVVVWVSVSESGWKSARRWNTTSVAYFTCIAFRWIPAGMHRSIGQEVAASRSRCRWSRGMSHAPAKARTVPSRRLPTQSAGPERPGVSGGSSRGRRSTRGRWTGVASGSYRSCRRQPPRRRHKPDRRPGELMSDPTPTSSPKQMVTYPHPLGEGPDAGALFREPLLRRGRILLVRMVRRRCRPNPSPFRRRPTETSLGVMWKRARTESRIMGRVCRANSNFNWRRIFSTTVR